MKKISQKCWMILLVGLSLSPTRLAGSCLEGPGPRCDFTPCNGFPLRCSKQCTQNAAFGYGNCSANGLSETKCTNVDNAQVWLYDGYCDLGVCYYYPRTSATQIGAFSQDTSPCGG